MVVCKYYRQGNCRYGEYCQYEHINTFGGKHENYNEDEITAVVVAREVVLAERGGQWLLSCFAPFKERPCIPGMEDLSPEEVRWEMYQAQKNNIVEEAKVRFQQLCQDMKAKREALKNPTRETIEMLKSLVGNSQKGGTVTKPSKFSFTNSQLNLPNTTSTSNIFNSKPFGNQNNVFNKGFGSSSNNNIFGTTSNTSSLFGTTSTFGGSATFPSTSSNSVFGGNVSTSVFGGTSKNQVFGNITPQVNPIFGGGPSQSMFGQPSSFGATSQTTNVFERSSQAPTSVFNSGTTSSTSMFGPSQATIFGESNPPASNPFGDTSTVQTSNSVFGSVPSTGTLSNNSPSMFGQPKTTAAFGGAPVFGTTGTFSSDNPAPTMFGQTQTSANNIFGRFNTTSSCFVNSGSTNQTTNTFSVTSSTTPNVFEMVQQNTIPAVVTAPSTTPFVSAIPTTSSPFVSTGTGFSTGNNTSSPFTTPKFGTLNTMSFMSTNTTVTSTAANPFVSQQVNSPFENAAQQGNVISSTGHPFGKPSFANTLDDTVINSSIYTDENQLTDDEKNMYLAENFVLGKIPLRPPSESLR